MAVTEGAGMWEGTDDAKNIREGPEAQNGKRRRTYLFTAAQIWPWITTDFPSLRPPKMGPIKGILCGMKQ